MRYSVFLICSYRENSATRTYQDIINKSTIETISGLKTHDKAIFDNVSKLVKAGMKTNLVDKAGHNWSLEGYARMVINTAAHNTYNQTRMNVMDKYGVTIAMMSSHNDARPACAPIQGLVVNVVPPDDPRYNSKYDSIYNHGYGEPSGTQGINCHHELFPYIEDVTTNPFIHPDTQKAIENGKIQQKQRALERRIKNDKKLLNTAKELGKKDDILKSEAKRNQHWSEIRNLIGNNRFLKRNYNRERFIAPNFDLTKEEKGAVIKYVSPDLYILNTSLREGHLTYKQVEWARNLDTAIDKLPKYKSDKPLYRSYQFNNEQLRKYIRNKQVGDVISDPAYFSTSKNIYDENDNFRIIVNKSHSGADLKGYIDAESEVLFKRNTMFKIVDAYITDKCPILEVEEFDSKKKK